MKNWKKFASLLLVLVMCLSLAACGGEAEEDVVVTVANQSGQDITSLSIAATTSASISSLKTFSENCSLLMILFIAL